MNKMWIFINHKVPILIHCEKYILLQYDVTHLGKLGVGYEELLSSQLSSKSKTILKEKKFFKYIGERWRWRRMALIFLNNINII